MEHWISVKFRWKVVVCKYKLLIVSDIQRINSDVGKIGT